MGCSSDHLASSHPFGDLQHKFSRAGFTRRAVGLDLGSCVTAWPPEDEIGLSTWWFQGRVSKGQKQNHQISRA